MQTYDDTRALRTLAVLSSLAAIIFASAAAFAAPQESEPVLQVLKADPEMKRAALLKLKSGYGEAWYSHWDSETGYARHLAGGLALSPGANGDPVGTARTFLEANRAIFGHSRKADTIVHAETRKGLFGTTVEFEQLYKGIEVDSASISVFINPDGAVAHVSSTAWPVRTVDTKPRITAKQAGNIVARSHGRVLVSELGPRELVILPRGGGILAWRSLDAVGTSRDPWRHVVDARTGALLERSDMRQILLPEADKPSPPDAMGATAGSSTPTDPCEKTWTLTLNDVIDDSVARDTYYRSFRVGADNFHNDSIPPNTQAIAMRGAGITLLPGIEYSIHVRMDGGTWDAYNATAGYNDLFFVAINSTGYFWNVHDGSPVGDHECDVWRHESNSPWGGGQLWTLGGTERDDTPCGGTYEFNFTYLETDLDKTVFLSLGLDTTGTLAGGADNEYPSYGYFFVTITAKTPYFNPNPVVTLNDSTLDDDNDNISAIETGGYALYEDPLPRLDWNDAQDNKLIGEYCKISEIGAPFMDEAYSWDGMFPTLRSCDCFEAVNAYLHITKYQEYLQSLGFTGSSAVNMRQIEVDPHWAPPNNIAGAWYYPNSTGTGTIRFADEKVDAAEDADIVIHEYGHACFDNLRPGVLSSQVVSPLSNSRETQAINEGAADFLAASYFRDAPSQSPGFDPAYVGEWFWTEYAAEHHRRVDRDWKYPANIIPNNKYKNCQIFSRVLWDISNEIGDDQAVKYLIAVIRGINENPTFIDVAKLMLLIDRTANYGVYEDEIKQAFEDRGILRRLKVRTADVHGNSDVVSAAVTASVTDMDGTTTGATPLDLLHPYKQTLTLVAPLNVDDAAFLGWILQDGAMVPGSPLGTIEVSLDQETIPTGGYFATAIYDVPLIGDLNGDGAVNGADLGMLLGSFGGAGSAGDLNDDGSVNGGDIGILLANWTG